MTEAINGIICGDCLEVLRNMNQKPKMIFADPPDNLGMQYDGYRDKRDRREYHQFLERVLREGFRHSSIFWLSYFHTYQSQVWRYVGEHEGARQFCWRFTFGQHNKHDCGNGYRPLMRLVHEGATLYPDAIREPSARQTKYKDKRANPKGRVPDDVWEFPRVCGTFRERRRWHPNQHPEALIERIVKFSAVPGDLVIDMFAGTGTVNRVCKRLGIDCIGIEISRKYCERIAGETGAELG